MRGLALTLTQFLYILIYVYSNCGINEPTNTCMSLVVINNAWKQGYTNLSSFIKIKFDANTAIWLADPSRATLVILNNLCCHCDVANDKFK